MTDSIARIDPNLPLPLYYQLKSLILQHIEHGEWRPNHAIPTEVELMNQYGVSRTTVREAVSSLVQEGYLVKKQGKGTFVREPRLQERLGKLTGFAEEMTQNGYRPSAKLIGVYTDLTEDEDFIRLELPDDEDWVKIERLRLASGEPIAIERSYWPKAIADVLVKEDLESVAYYTALEENRVFLKYAEEDISAVNANTIDSTALRIRQGSSMIEMTRFTYDVADRLIEYTCTRYRGDRYKYHVHLER